MKHLIRFWHKWWNELLFPLMTLVVWLVSPDLVTRIDERSGTYDQGILQVIFFTVLQFAFYAAIAWIFIRATFAVIFNYYQSDFINDFKNLTPCVKLCISLGLFVALLFVLALLSRVL